MVKKELKNRLFCMNLFAFFTCIGCFIYVINDFIGKKNVISKSEEKTDSMIKDSPTGESIQLACYDIPMKSFPVRIHFPSQQNPVYAQIGFDIPTKEENPEFLEPMILKLRPDGYFHGVNVTTDRITVLYSGLYYVYSSINFRLDGIKCSEVTYQNWFHYISRTIKSDSMTVPLLKMAYTCCYDCSLTEATKYLAGLFYLEVGDAITTACSGQNLVKAVQESSFMGLFMLKSGLDNVS